jgi:hypothetical protein
MRDAPRDRQYLRAVLDRDRRAAAAREAADPRRPPRPRGRAGRPPNDALHLEPLKADEAANVVLHPLFLLARHLLSTQSLARAADVSSEPLNPRSARPQFGRTGGQPPRREGRRPPARRLRNVGFSACSGTRGPGLEKQGAGSRSCERPRHNGDAGGPGRPSRLRSETAGLLTRLSTASRRAVNRSPKASMFLRGGSSIPRRPTLARRPAPAAEPRAGTQPCARRLAGPFENLHCVGTSNTCR